MDKERTYKVMLVGHFTTGSLESSYKAAFGDLKCKVSTFDIAARIDHYCRLGKFGRIFNKFVPVEPWIRKALRDMVLHALEVRPDFVITFGQYPIRAGGLAQIAATTDARLVHIWPDTLLNLPTALITCLPLYDLVATYSRLSALPFQRLGAKHVEWLPLAADPRLHEPSHPAPHLGADITFIGGWRPEREAVLSKLGDFDLKIWGPEWGQRCRGNKAILRAWQGRPLFGRDFAKAVAASKINLNVIDPTNYPAANMRFFEIPCAGGLQVASSCPEMEDEFRDGEEIFYYREPGDLPGLVQHLLKSDDLRAKVASRGQAQVLARHTYKHRAAEIIAYFEGGPLSG